MRLNSSISQAFIFSAKHLASQSISAKANGIPKALTINSELQTDVRGSKSCHTKYCVLVEPVGQLSELG